MSLQVLQSDGGNYCASVNAATLAVIDAGLPMKDYITACSASIVNETPIVDINNFEESAGNLEILIAVLPRSSQIVFMEMNGKLHEDHLEKVIDTAMVGCSDVYDILDQSVRDHVSHLSSALCLNK